MAFNAELDGILEVLAAKDRMEKKKMFGGTCYLQKGKLTFGVWKDYLILRLGEDKAAAALKDKKFHVFDITGRAMKGWAMIRYRDLDEKMIKTWTGEAKKFVSTLKD